MWIDSKFSDSTTYAAMRMHYFRAHRDVFKTPEDREWLEETLEQFVTKEDKGEQMGNLVWD